MRRNAIYTTAIVLILLSFIPACQVDLNKAKQDAAKATSTLNDIDAEIEATLQRAEGYEAAIESLKAEIEKAPKGKVRDALVKVLEKTKDNLASARAKLRRYDDKRSVVVEQANTSNKIIQEAETQGDLIAGLVAQYAGFLPPPYGTAIALGGPLVFSFLRGRKHKADAVEEKKRVVEEKKKTADMKRKAIAMVHNIDAIIKDPHMGESEPGKGDGLGKFDSTDPKMMHRLKELDRLSGVTGLTAEAME